MPVQHEFEVVAGDWFIRLSADTLQTATIGACQALTAHLTGREEAPGRDGVARLDVVHSGRCQCHGTEPVTPAQEGRTMTMVRLHRCPECGQVRDTSDAAPHSIYSCDGWEDAPHDEVRMLPGTYRYLGPAVDTDQGRWAAVEGTQP